jgi:hypothetical protein
LVSRTRLSEPGYFFRHSGLHHLSNSPPNNVVCLSDRIVGQMGIPFGGCISQVAENFAGEIKTHTSTDSH